MTDDTNIAKADFLDNVEAGWRKLEIFITSLTDEQLTKPTDAAGWTVKDHLIHLAVWENGVSAMLEHKPRYEAMGLTKQDWDNEHYDKLNAIIQQQQKDLPLSDVLKRLREVHLRLLELLDSVSDADLQRPYSDYQAGEDDNSPIINRLIGNTYAHYDEHIPWMQAIAGV